MSDSQTTMKRVGDILRTAREKKGLSHDDVHKFIKIHPKYLKALEENDYRVFSSPVHIKGFIKVYSTLLDLNVDEVLAFWRREYDEKKMNSIRTIRPIEEPKVAITPTLVLVVSTIILVLVFFGYLFYQYRSYTGAPALVIESPKESLTSSENKLEVVGRTDRDSSVFLNGQKININPDGTFATNIDLVSGMNTLNFLSVNKLGKETKLVRTVVVKDDLLAVVEGTSSARPKQLSLEVSANKGSSVILVNSDGKVVFDGMMLFGTSKVFEASQSLSLKAFNSGAMTVKFNGSDLGTFGKVGEVVEKVFK